MSLFTHSETRKKIAATLAASSALGALSGFSFPSQARAQAPSLGATSSPAVAKARAFAYQNTHEPISDLGKLAASQLAAFGRAMGIPSSELQNPKVAYYGTYVVAVTDKWIYDGDLSGNQCLRPISALPYLVQGFDHPGTLGASSEIASKVTAEGRNIVSVLGLRADLKNAYCKKEQILTEQCRINGQPLLYDGRNFVRLCDDNGIFLQLISDSKCNPIRVETNIECEATRTLSKLLYQQLKDGAAFSPKSCGADDMAFGTFFSQHENRFEVNALSFEGHQLPSVTVKENPYDSATQSNDWWGYRWWDQNGRGDGIRGNWDAANHTWQKPDIKVMHHAMDDYPMVGPTNLDSNAIDPRFHRDLEACTVGVFLTHGGPINNNFQMDSGKTWFKPGDPQLKYGSGNLRHLVFNTCGAMGFTTETNGGGYKSLISEWLPGKYVDGLRTACGNDGESADLDRDGWRFFNRYNKGDSISAAWMYSSIVECAQNAPATVAYGSSPDEALTTLADGRFNKERAEPAFAVASLWREIK